MRALGSGQLGGRRPKKGESDVRLFKNFSGIRGDSSVAAEARMMLDLWWTLNLFSLKSCLWSETSIETFLRNNSHFASTFQDSFSPVIRSIGDRASWTTGLATDTWTDDAELLQVGILTNVSSIFVTFWVMKDNLDARSLVGEYGKF